MKSGKDLPAFVVYQPDPKEFHICLEVGSIYYCWRSNYPPARDNRFVRKVERLKAIIPKKIPPKQVYDKGTYTVNKGDDKAAIEKKVKEGIKQKSFSFILNGEILKGRFIIKKASGGTVIQKFKDRFAVEEDIFSEDLNRTIKLMVPDYDPDAAEPDYPEKRKASAKSDTAKPVGDIEEEPDEEITADKKIGNTGYHFTFYNSDTGPGLCVVLNSRNEILVLQKSGKGWQLLQPARAAVLKTKKALIEHAKALYQLQDKEKD